MGESNSTSNVRNKMLTGVFWSAIEKYSSQIMSVIVSMVLARLLSPQEFGVVTIATVVLTFLSLFSTIGFGPAIIQRKDLEYLDYNSIFSLTVYLGLGLSVLLFLYSDIIADYFGNKQISIIVQILSINVFFSAINVVPNALMYKNQRFKEIAKRTLIIQVLTGPISIFAAYFGLGIYSLLISPIVSSVFIFLYNIHRYPCSFLFFFNVNSLKKIFSYSAFQFMFELSNYFSRNLDKFVIGKSLSQIDLGYYDKSYRLMQLPLSNVSSVLGPVIQPVLSYLQDDKKLLAEKYNRIIKLMATIGFPIGVFLAASGYELIYIMFGQKWMAAVPSFCILAYSIPIQLLLGTSGSIFQSANATNHLFFTGIRNTVIVIAGFVVAAVQYKTIESFAAAWTICEVLVFFSSYVDLYIFVLKSSFKAMLKELVFPIVYGVILFILLHIICFPENVFLSVILKFLTSLFVTLILIQVFRQYSIIDLLKKSFLNLMLICKK